MEQKNFYSAFNILYDRAGKKLSIFQKEEFYRRLFGDVYRVAYDDMLDSDSLRKVTSGNQPIHHKATKILRTYEGFELLRSAVEEVFAEIDDVLSVLSEVLTVVDWDDTIPEEVKKLISKSCTGDNPYQYSRMIAAALVCLNHSDYMKQRGTGEFFSTDFMRFSADKPLARYPKYISDMPNAAVEDLLGRKDEIQQIYHEVIERHNNILISAVGGLGKTELAKAILEKISHSEVTETGIETIAWIPYDNQDILLSIRGAMHLNCEPEEVWMKLQDIAFDYGDRLLLVVDNVESPENDEYLLKLGSLPCRILITTRQKELRGFSNIFYLQPLSMDSCRKLFYSHYEFEERDNETVNDIISLTAGLTIMIVFIAKVAYLEGMTLRELYASLVEKGFKLSREDVSCEHEKMQDDRTIIQQMCILFSLVAYSDQDKSILTYISIIPNLQFDFPKAKRWFGIKRNSSLMRLFKVGMLEHVTEKKKHIYWMHSVIAAAVREQQKAKLYDLSRPFIGILTEELNTGPAFGREYEKAYLIPFSWSASDIMEDHWHSEEDTDFLTSLFHVCFSCSNFRLCEKLIDKIIEIQQDPEQFTAIELAFSYRNKIDLLQQFDRAEEAGVLFKEIEKLFDERGVPEADREILNAQYGIYYQIRGDYKKSREYFEKCIHHAETDESETKSKDISTACTNMARMLLDAGDLFEAYKYVKRAIEVEDTDEGDADQMVCYSTLAATCTELMNAGYGTNFVHEANDAFNKVIRFREKNLGKHHADTAVVYHDYSFFLYICGLYDEALKYNEMAYNIDRELFAEHSITRMRSLNTKALIIWEQDNYQEADDIFEYTIDVTRQLSSDYLVDLADFEFNYARCLHEQGDDENSKIHYAACIDIWSEMPNVGHRNLMLSYQERGDILFTEGRAEDALADYEKAVQYNSEDFYVMADVMDSIAACFFLMDKMEESSQKFAELLRFLVEYNAHDAETKYHLCNNLLCIMDAESEEESALRERILKLVANEPEVKSYADIFLMDLKEKQHIG